MQCKCILFIVLQNVHNIFYLSNKRWLFLFVSFSALSGSWECTSFTREILIDLHYKQHEDSFAFSWNSMVICRVCCESIQLLCFQWWLNSTCTKIVDINYSSSCAAAASPSVCDEWAQAAGVSILNKYSQRLGSDTAVSLVSKPHSSSTTVERWGPFQQAAPFEYTIVEYLFGFPSHLSQPPSLTENKKRIRN